MKYGKLNLGQIEAIVNKLGGMDVVRGILSERKKVAVMSAQPWAEIRIGTFANVEALRRALDEADSGDDSDLSMSSRRVPDDLHMSSLATIRLVVLNVASLGFEDGVETAEIYDTAEELGLGLCPDETAAQMLLQCAGLNVDDRRLNFATRIFYRGGFAISFSKTGKPYLDRFTNAPHHPRHGYEKFVFTLAR